MRSIHPVPLRALPPMSRVTWLRPLIPLAPRWLSPRRSWRLAASAWSQVSCSQPAEPARYTRVSPTCAMWATPSCTLMAEATQPMPSSALSAAAASWTRSLARSRPFTGSCCSRSASRARAAARWPPFSPPMPSMTAKRPDSTAQRNASWLSLRTAPLSVRAAASSGPPPTRPVRSAFSSISSTALNAMDGEVHLAVRQRDVDREAVDRDLPAGLDEPPRDLHRVGLGETAYDDAAGPGLDPELALVDLRVGAAEAHEAVGDRLVRPSQHDPRAVGHAGVSARPLHAQAPAVERLVAHAHGGLFDERPRGQRAAHAHRHLRGIRRGQLLGLGEVALDDGPSVAHAAALVAHQPHVQRAHHLRLQGRQLLLHHAAQVAHQRAFQLLDARPVGEVEEHRVVVPDQRRAGGGAVRALAHHLLDRLGDQEGIDRHLAAAPPGIAAGAQRRPVDLEGLGVVLVLRESSHRPTPPPLAARRGSASCRR